MAENNQSDLLDFVRSRSEESFNRIVSEFGGLVLASALRRTGDRELAEEITQNVFTILARKAAVVAKHPSVNGWLFTTTQLESVKAMRSRKRHQRKIDALTLNTLPDNASQPTENFLPQLDEALDHLSKIDRNFLLARFIEEATFRELARRTGKSESACKMRVKRALDQLRCWMTARGITVSVTTLSLFLSSKMSSALPLATVAKLSSGSLSVAVSAPSGGLFITQIVPLMHTAKTNTIVVAAIAIAIGAAPLLWQFSVAENLRDDLGQAQLATQFSTRKIQTRTSSADSGTNQPIKYFINNSLFPEDGGAFLTAIEDSVVLNSSEILARFHLPLSRGTPEQVQDLIRDVEASDKLISIKGDALEILMKFARMPDSDPQLAIETLIGGEGRGLKLTRMMSDWLERDPSAAESWFREKLKTGELVGKGAAKSPETFLAEELVGFLAATNQESAILLVDEVNQVGRGEVIAKLLPVLVQKGESSWPQVHELMNSLQGRDIHRTTLEQVLEHFPDRNRIRPFLDGLNLSASESGYALAKAASHGAKNQAESISDRMEWLINEVKPEEQHEAVNFAALSISSSHPDEIENWTATLEPGKGRDAALDGLSIGLLASGSYERSSGIVKLIDDPEIQQKALQQLLNHAELGGEEIVLKIQQQWDISTTK